MRSSPFADSYRQARRKFLEAAATAGASLVSHRHPLPAPDGTPLHVDIARVGAEAAGNVMLTCSGTHGIEGFCGSGCQVAWLRGEAPTRLPDDVAVVLVHAINPFGFAWLRRTDADNVDLNRNFIDHDRPPQNHGWQELAAALSPREWDEHAGRIMAVAISLFVERHGQAAYVAAATGGQYTHPDGMFFGGTKPAWSNRLLRGYVEHHLREARSLAVIDIHTGLGAFGQAELICRHPPDSAALARARRWYGERVTSPAAGESASAVVDGSLRMAFIDWLPDCEVTAVGLELGTHSEARVFKALVADDWLRRQGDPTSRRGRAIKAELREAFFPDSEEWRAAVLEQAETVQAKALAGLRE